MIKTGICCLDDLVFGKDCTLFRKELKNVSISLYEQACSQKNANALTQRILLLFSDERGAYKRTYLKRFEKFDKEVCKILQQNFGAKKHIDIHDVGVSDGRTSVDFYKKIAKLYPSVIFTASDYNPTIKMIEKGRAIA